MKVCQKGHLSTYCIELGYDFFENYFLVSWKKYSLDDAQRMMMMMNAQISLKLLGRLSWPGC